MEDNVSSEIASKAGIPIVVYLIEGTSSCGEGFGHWPTVPFYVVFGFFTPFFVFSSNLSKYKKKYIEEKNNKTFKNPKKIYFCQLSVVIF